MFSRFLCIVELKKNFLLLKKYNFFNLKLFLILFKKGCYKIKLFYFGKIKKIRIQITLNIPKFYYKQEKTNRKTINKSNLNKAAL